MLDYSNLNDMHFDVLREIGNIGSGNAATALAAMLGKTIQISVPKVSLAGFNETLDSLGGATTVAVGVLVSFTGEVNGMMMLLIGIEDAKSITCGLLQREDCSTELDDMELSALKEVGNILVASYMNSLSQLTGLKIDVSVPGIAIDMIGALMDFPIIEFGAIADKLLFIEGSFIGNDSEMASNIIMFTQIETLEIIMERLGLGI